MSERRHDGEQRHCALCMHCCPIPDGRVQPGMSSLNDDEGLLRASYMKPHRRIQPTSDPYMLLLSVRRWHRVGYPKNAGRCIASPATSTPSGLAKQGSSRSRLLQVSLQGCRVPASHLCIYLRYLCEVVCNLCNCPRTLCVYIPRPMQHTEYRGEKH